MRGQISLMSFKFLRFVWAGLLVAVVGVSGVLAQPSTLAETFISTFGFQFDHPAGWLVEETPADEDSGSLTVATSADSALIVFFFEPAPLRFVGTGATPVDVMANRWEELIIGTPTATTDANGREMVTAVMSLDGTPGVGYMINFGDEAGWGLMAGWDANEARKVVGEDVEALFDDIAATFGPAGSPTGEPPQRLVSFGGNWQTAVDELAEAGVISSGGFLVFNEPRAFFDGQGNFFTPLARNAPYANIVMAGEITYTASNTSELETCALMAGIMPGTGNTVNTYAEVGFTNSSLFYYIDRFQGEALTVEQLAQNVPLTRSHHVLFIIRDGEMTVYLDGELMATGLPMRERAGTYGIGLTGKTAAAACVGENIWVYQVPDVVEPGVCQATANSNVNKRSGPGTNNAQAGTFRAGTSQQVIGQASDGAFRWWQLDDNTWVREDVVTVSGDCAGVPATR